MLKEQYWYRFAAALDTELRQSRDEGRDVSALEEKVRSLGIDVSYTPEEDAAVMALLDEFDRLPASPENEAREPSDLPGIERFWTDSVLEPETPDPAAIRDKISGAWTGRLAGCILGKPVENLHKDVIRKLAAAGGNLPIRGYLKGRVKFSDPAIRPEALEQGWFLENLSVPGPSDDDINYTVLGLKIVELYGPDFTPEDVAEAWLANLPALALCTAEHAAYRNLLNHILPPRSAAVRNPYREWIGAQIRGDFFGYLHAGNPKAAARAAYRDACISHVKNGIYGELFAAALIAKAAVTDDVEAVFRAGTAVIPPQSRLRRELEGLARRRAAGATFEEVLDDLYRRYPADSMHNTVHTIPNAVIVAAALLYGEGDFTRTLGLSAEAGMDTDCNGATVGSAVGMMNGFARIDPAWYVPFGARVRTDIMGFSEVSVDELTQRTLKVMGRKA